MIVVEEDDPLSRNLDNGKDTIPMSRAKSRGAGLESDIKIKITKKEIEKKRV